MITFRPKNDPIDDEHPEFDLTLSKKMNYDAVSRAMLSCRNSYRSLDVG